jgi:CHAT domain-containing protein
MKNRCLLLLLSIFFISSCVSGIDLRTGSLLQQMKYDTLISELQPMLDQGTKVSSWNINCLCYAYYGSKKYDKLLSCSQNLENSIKGGDRYYMHIDLTVSPDMFRALTYLDLGDYQKALKYAQNSLAVLKDENTSRTISMLTVAGMANALMGSTIEAQANIQRLNGMQAESNFVLAPEKYISLARIHMALKEFDKALAAIQNSKANVVRPGITYAFGVDYTFQDFPKYFILTKCLFETGRINEARQGYDQLLNHPQIAQAGDTYWIALYDRDRIALKDGKPDDAIIFMKRALEVIEQQRASINTDLGKIGFVGDKQDVYQLLIATLFDKGKIVEAFEYVERAKARALVDLLANRQKFAYKGTSPEKTAAMLAELTSLEAKSRSYVADDGKDGKSASTRSVMVKVRKDLANAAPQLASLVTVTSPKTAEIQNLLKPNETLLEYYAQGDDLFAFVMMKESIDAVKLSGKGLTDIISNLRQAIQNPKSTDYKAISQKLYDRIIAPVPAVTSKANLIIVPHGAMHYLPFNMLSSGKDNLIDRVNIRILPSASVMTFLASRQESVRNKVLIIGNPTLGDPKLNLEGAEAEAKAIQNIWPDSVLLLRKEATKGIVMKTGNQFRIIHFAAHGIFNVDQPLNSALLLSPDHGDDGTLTVGELYEMTLNADLVTLSACETGIGKISNGDDVVGLTRGFLYAGAASIVASLWPVPDTETMFLMNNFYKHLKDEIGPNALRNAQLAARGKYTHPYYWAAFQWTGSADSIALKHSTQ